MKSQSSPQPDLAAESLARLTALTAAAIDSAQRDQDGELMQVLDQRQVEIDRLGAHTFTGDHQAAIAGLQSLEAQLRERLESTRHQSISELKKGQVGRRASSAYARR